MVCEEMKITVVVEKGYYSSLCQNATKKVFNSTEV